MFEGMQIETFPDTNVENYIKMIHSKGYSASRKGRIITVGKLLKDPKKIQENARRLRKARRQKNLDREQLAELMGVNESTVFNWEVGRREPNEKNKNKIERILEVQIWEKQ